MTTRGFGWGVEKAIVVMLPIKDSQSELGKTASAPMKTWATDLIDVRRYDANNSLVKAGKFLFQIYAPNVFTLGIMRFPSDGGPPLDITVEGGTVDRAAGKPDWWDVMSISTSSFVGFDIPLSTATSTPSPTVLPPTHHDFGIVPTSSPDVSHVFRIATPDTIGLTIVGYTLSRSNTDRSEFWTFQRAAGDTILPQTTITLTAHVGVCIRCVVPYEATLVIATSGPAITLTARIKLTNQRLLVEPPAYDFGQIHVQDRTSYSVAFNLKNNGSWDDLAVTSISVVDPTGTFFISQGAVFPYPSLDTWLVMIDLRPQTAYKGLRTASLRIRSNDVFRPLLDVPLAALIADVSIQVTPAAFNFGVHHVAVGPSAPFTVSVLNKGNHGDLPIQSISLSNSEFTIIEGSAATPIVVGAGKKWPVRIVFAPSGVLPASKAAIVSIRSVGANGEQLWNNVTVSGTAVDQTVILNRTGPFEFGNVDTFDSPAELVFELSNGAKGMDLLEVAAGELTNSADFTLQPATARILNPGQAVQYQIRFKPQSIGLKSGEIFLNTNDPANPRVRLLFSGVGVHPDIAVPRRFVDFGNWDVYARDKAVQPLPVSNVGETVLTIRNVTWITNTGNAYVVTPTSALLQPGMAMTFYVSWNPQSPNGAQLGAIELLSDDLNEPALRVDLKGQAIQELARDFPPGKKASIAFCPAHAGLVSDMTLIVHTSDRGLPHDGSLQIAFPPGFGFSWLWVELEGKHIDNTSVNVNNGKLRINLGSSNVTGVAKSNPFTVVLHRLQLPSAAQCDSFPAWVWNITTHDAAGGLLEYFWKFNLLGDVCLAPITYTIFTTPTSQVLEAGMTARFEVTIGNPDLVRSLGRPLLNTSRMGDVLQVIPTMVNGALQFCHEDWVANDSLAMEARSDDLGPTDAVDQITAHWQSAFYPGTYRLCLYQKHGPCGWKQVGDPFEVVSRQYAALPEPVALASPVVLTPAWLSFSPKKVIQYDSPRFTILGFHSFGGTPLRLKAAGHFEDCSLTADGVPSEGGEVVNHQATLQVNTPGIYKMCLHYDFEWQPMEGVLWVSALETANLATDPQHAFNGFASCAAWVARFPDRCGCFYGNGTTEVTVELAENTQLLMDAAQAQPLLTINQGCCIMPTSTRQTGDREGRVWGFCSTQT
eukprot:NODE_31_length_4050_cov_62.961254_g28_i0.p1 GENE.NODE_31_length_4050_cov_62.961254_g28_i0~~NODE_31_length_4050_cov_62.961254_g28_i0.p1  ORF type:complete len:1158 (-),score=287.71 NODE_31_length_4050_cov_62.961254_g28_i0:66-3539(-)